MVQILNREDEIYPAVEAGELTIDAEGRIWKVGTRRANRWNGGTKFYPCPPRRAENRTGGTGYLQVRLLINGVRVHALAHRLVYRHLHGPIPEGMVINHRNGDKADNRPANLEATTYSENTLHSLHELGRGRTDQTGELNAMAKLTAEQVAMIRIRREKGELLTVIAADFGISQQAVSKIARGERWAALAG